MLTLSALRTHLNLTIGVHGLGSRNPGYSRPTGPTMEGRSAMRKGIFQTAQEIMDAVDRGESVYWNSLRYPVHKDRRGQYFIGEGAAMIGLTWADGTTLNAAAKDFFVLDAIDKIGPAVDSLH